MTRLVTATAALTLVYAFALASFHPWDLAFGALLAGTLVWTSRRFVFGPAENRAPRPSLLARVLAFFPFAGVVFIDILKGTLEVTLVTLHLRRLVKPGIVTTPIGERSPLGVALVHLLDARDPEAFRRRQADFYRRYQSRVFP